MPKRVTTRGLKKKAWKLMSEYVRRKDANFFGMVNCYTCDKPMPWKEAHAGHFKHNKLDFDERNIKPQCSGCNTYRGGRLDVYAIRLVREHGLEWVQQLERDAAQFKGYTFSQLLRIIDTLKVKINHLDATPKKR